MGLTRRRYVISGVRADGVAGLAALLAACGAPGSAPGTTGPAAQPVTIRWTNTVGNPLGTHDGRDGPRRSARLLEGR